MLDLGLVGTEMVYFAVGELELDGGIMVTASHNPKEYTGMKIVRRGALPVGGESGLLDVRDRALAIADREAGRRGKVLPIDIWPRYVDRVLSFIDVSALGPLQGGDRRRERDGGPDAPAGPRAPAGVEAVRCFFDPDGSFPNHEPNPLLPENREFIVRKTLEEGADLGVAFDGDADRCFFVDDSASSCRRLRYGAARGARAGEGARREDHLRRAGELVGAGDDRACRGVPLINRVGHAYIKHRMRKDDAAFGGEVSGHYYFRGFSQADSGVVPFLLMLELISKEGRSSREMLEPFRSRYFITGELNTPVSDVALSCRSLKERYASEGEVSHLDGISVDADDWHFNVRPWNTEPLLRLNLEARSRRANGTKARRGARPDPIVRLRGGFGGQGISQLMSDTKSCPP